VLVAIFAFVVMNSGSLLKTAVETLGPEYLGVDVRLDAAEISLSDGSGELRGLTISNPAGYPGAHAFKLGRIKLVLDPATITEEVIVIKNIVVDAADLVIVAKGRDTNLQAIMSNLDSEAGGPDSADESSGTGPNLIIDRFDFTNARSTLDSDLLGQKSVDVPDIRLNDIGRKSQGVTIREALSQLLRPIVSATTEALAKESLNVDEIIQGLEERADEELKDGPGSDLDDLKDRFRN
jgi:hypothetical protein